MGLVKNPVVEIPEWAALFCRFTVKRSGIKSYDKVVHFQGFFATHPWNRPDSKS